MKNKSINIILMFVVIINLFTFCDDSFITVAKSSLPMVDFSDSVITSLGGFSKSTAYKYGTSSASSGFKAVASTKESKVFDFSSNGISSDWSHGNSIVLPVYNVYANDDVVNLIFVTSGSTKELSEGYFSAKIKLNWIGWKLVVIPKSDFIPHSSAKWNNINSMFFNIGGWGESKPSGTLEIYVDSVYTASTQNTGGMNISTDNPLISKAMNLTYEKVNTDDSSRYAHFKASGKETSTSAFAFSDFDISTDWQAAKDVVIKIYNRNANNQKVNFIMNYESDKSTSGGYYLYSFYLDWTGWRELVIPLSYFKAMGVISGFNHIGTMYFNVGGWPSGSEVKSDVDFYIAYVKGKGMAEYVADSIPDSCAVYAGASDALKELKHVSLSNAPDCSDGIIYAPLTLFEELFAMKSESDTLASDLLFMKFEDGSPYVKIGDYTHTLTKASYMKNEVIYVPLVDMCLLLNIPVHTDGRLAVMGSESDIDTILESYDCGINEINEQIAQKITFDSNGEYTNDDCEILIANRLRALVGNEELNDLSNPGIESKISKITSDAESLRAKLNKAEGSSELFSDQTSTQTAHMTTTAQRIKQLAIAYGTYGSTLYQNEELLSDILYCLEWFYQNRYGEDELNGNGWHSTSGFNWADWKAGTPKHLIDAIMIVRTHLTPKQISDYLMLFNRLSPDVYSTGANYIDSALLIINAAALENNPERVMQFKSKAEEAFLYVDNGRFPESQLDAERQAYTLSKGHGFYRDGSYLFHTLHAMNGSYGLSHLTMSAELIRLFDGTSCGISKPSADNMADWIINSFDSGIYGTRMMRMFLGRHDNPAEIGEAKTIVAAAVKCFDYFSEEDQHIIGSIIKKYADSGRGDIGDLVEFEYLDKYNEIVSNEEYNAYRTNLSKVFGNIDKVMYRREEWGIGVSMSSSRIFNYESINSQNLTGWYLGDGRTELILKNNSNKSVSEYWKNINYYRLPGTTVDTQERKAVSVCQGNEYLSSQDFVGGAELEGEYSVAAMHLESYHNESDFGKDGGSYGGPNPAHQSDLTAKKSYFMFDNEVYCLGAEVNASANNNAEVLTVFENTPTHCIGSAALITEKAGANVETKRFDFSLSGIPTNWSSVSKIKIPLYSKEANGDYVNIIFSRKSGSLDGYYRYNLQLNWSGWKTVEIPLTAFSKYGGISSWSDINAMYFNIGGWKNPAPLASTVLYISDVQGLDAKGNTLCEIEFSDSLICEKANAKFVMETPDGTNESGAEIITGSGKKIIRHGGENILGDVKWLNVNENTGYYFPKEFNTGALKGNISSNGYFEGYISHGINPAGSSYAYAILPGMNSETTKAYAENPDIEILSNTGDVQAVRYNKQNITSIVFWNAGTFEGITVSEPMIVMIKECGNQIMLSVSDPTHKLTDATLSFSKPVLILNGNNRISQLSFGNESVLNIDFSECNGSSLEAKLMENIAIIDSVVFKDEKGRIISKYISQNESEVNVEISVANTGDAIYNGNAYAVMYSAKGILESIQHLPVENLAPGEARNIPFNLVPTSQTKRIEIYVWDKASLKPVYAG